MKQIKSFLPLSLGQLVQTPGVMREIDAGSLMACLNRHTNGDWGDLCEDDKNSNDLAVIEGDRVLSSYKLGNKKLWIITEYDRSITTLLLPEEY
jgi:hypothetical protein